MYLYLIHSRPGGREKIRIGNHDYILIDGYVEKRPSLAVLNFAVRLDHLFAFIFSKLLCTYLGTAQVVEL